jgi:hypothetical protein
MIAIICANLEVYLLIIVLHNYFVLKYVESEIQKPFFSLIYRVIYNRCKKLGHRVREVILRKKCYMNVGPILIVYRTTSTTNNIISETSN